MTVMNEKNYRELLIAPVRECANYSPKFGHSKNGGFTLSEFQSLYSKDIFYRWLGLNSPLMYSAHKAAGGITSIYRQIGIGCERLIREILKDYLGLSENEVNWSYMVAASNGSERKLSLDARIIFDAIADENAKRRIVDWKDKILNEMGLPTLTCNAITGIVFEIRQGYKSKDSKRQNADISNAANAFANGYIPCLLVMSAQIDDDIAARYRQSKWWLLQGFIGDNPYLSSYDFFKEIIGFDLSGFMTNNQEYFQKEIHAVLNQLMRVET